MSKPSTNSRASLNRRYFLAGLGLVVSLPGCSDIQRTNQELGTPVEYNGVKVTPNKYLITQTISVSGGYNFVNHTAPNGATYLLTHIKSEHTGENKRVFPIRGQNAFSTDIVTEYNGEQLRNPDWESYSAFRINGRELTPYMNAVDPNNFYNGRFEGSASGWIVDTITADFTPSNVSITISWGAKTHTVNPDNVRSYTWGYTAEAERALEKIG